MHVWADEEKLGVRERAQLNQKLDMLGRIGFETAKHLEFLKGTSGDYNHIFKLVVKSQRMLRPMLCRGPRDCAIEVTLLAGAIEKDSRLHPADAAGQAETRRRLLMKLPEGHTQYRIPHERF
jgi:hypothetical protein